MAVFTPVDETDARALLADYSLGELRALRGIPSGIENTNYFLTTSRGEYVLTLFERLTREQLPFYIDLMTHLAEHGIPVPHPQATVDGRRLAELHGKPCTIATLLPGKCEMAPLASHCAQVGATLARMHLAGKDFPAYQPNLLGVDWWRETAPVLLPYLNADAAAMLRDEVDFQVAFAASAAYRQLPAGPAHCDLFRDNVLFAGTREAPELGGFIDFYFAGCDTWLFDLAVCVNDWCIDHASGEFRPELMQSLLNAYAQVRPLTDVERDSWRTLLRAAALRFWMSRLRDFHLPRPAQTLTPHDPAHFERILRLRRDGEPLPLP
ncbi:homoserine kinase [Pigmentiphaga sp.]|jgi:homoserine kinase, Neisseria type|uniref:homoserine kinase n=1 Tax=Pigmentiphaga sp. TaxID=1977564 RepID=UPI0025E529AC|nr:homoserine kinase [Pigmentiphaga sp.]MBX6318094.1 homoserine kinase [Pigmentiphaga sp.]